MAAQHTMPSPVRTVRVLLLLAALLTLMAALDGGLRIGGSEGFGVAFAFALPAVAGLAAAWAIEKRPSRKLWIAVIVLEVLYLFWQFGRISDGDPFGLLGLVFPIAILVLVSRSSARDYFYRAR
ncbi:hypothetical protein DPM19_30085 [Actinomadura craniellae]|uniref:DUF2568 domain-containing protein n=1 Tax=Actinomadura craniellae TaxID=2231787 RepID=A0A365H026_9ACTN|nr:hypothetical protein [Actinomadura craniellae]RAY11553.1 hypothetical protein DPM19_30085 [Actinomadura craniellae]